MTAQPLRDLEPSLSKEQFALWDVAPIPQREAGVVSTGAGGWIWVGYRPPHPGPRGCLMRSVTTCC